MTESRRDGTILTTSHRCWQIAIPAIILLAACSAWGRCPGAMAVPAQRVFQLQRLLPPPPSKAQESNKTEFRVYADVSNPDRQTRLVLYSYNAPPPNTWTDTDHSLYLAVLSGAGGTEKVESNLEITKLIPISMGPDEPGEVLSLDGCLNPFAAPDAALVHVHLWSEISGSGMHNAASDYFFRLTDTLELRRALELKETSRWGRMGEDYHLRHDSTVALLSATLTSPLEVLHQFRQNDVFEGKQQVFSEQKVYRWNGARFDNGTVITEQQFASKMKRARVLVRAGPVADGNAAGNQQPGRSGEVPSR